VFLGESRAAFGIFCFVFAAFYSVAVLMMNSLDDSKQLLPAQPPALVRTASVQPASEGARTYVWRSCCLDMDSRALLFFSQLIISLLMLIFCIYEIALLESEWAKLTASFIMGVWLPQPRVSKT